MALRPKEKPQRSPRARRRSGNTPFPWLLLSLPPTARADLRAIWQIMEEIIAKSKERKAEKAKLKEADTDATEALDRELAHLMQAGALHSLMGGKRRSAGAADDAEAAYDRDRLELVYQAKAKVRSVALAARASPSIAAGGSLMALMAAGWGQAEDRGRDCRGAGQACQGRGSQAEAAHDGGGWRCRACH